MKISIVIPSFNEEKNIPVLFDEIREVLKGEDFECIFIDDGSSDETFSIIKGLSAHYAEVKGISFSRNFGHQIALLAGISESLGDITISMDADGQHPASVIPDLIEKYQQGFDIVNTRRLKTEDAGLIKNMTSKGFYTFINKMTDVKIEPASSDFRLMSRKAVDAFLQFEEKDRFTRGLISWMGFKQAFVEFDAPRRRSGVSKYTFRKMLHFAWDGITSFSSKPLKISLYVGLLSLGMGFLYAVYALIEFILGNTIPGWTSMMLVILFLGGVQLLSLGIIGQYLSRIFNEAKNRPSYFIQDRC
ncbi:MAG: glycosyltransferase family 2 protein [Salinivirgaceae bacterium]|nr:glycosyltransferase family 2 protein [Salinivirgaceae bacterium]